MGKLLTLISLIVCIILFVLLFGISYERFNYDSTINGHNLRQLLPNLPDENSINEDINNITFSIPTNYNRIIIHPLRLLIGSVVGSVLIFLLIYYYKKYFSEYRTVKKDRGYNIKNIIFVTAFIITTIVISLTSDYIYHENIPITDDLREHICHKYSFLLGLLISYVIFGRLITVSKRISSFIQKLFLGPFNWFNIKLFSQGELRILWITILLTIFFTFFPPWNAYHGAIELDNNQLQGIGEPVFADFKFVLSHKRSIILGEAPYITVEINHHFQKIIIIITLTVGLSLMAISIVKRMICKMLSRHFEKKNLDR